MAGEAEQMAGGKLRRRATIFMTGAALTGFYMWMQPAALGTLETNSAQAADGSSTGGCVLKLGNQEVRVQSRELCGTAPAPTNLVPVQAPVAPAAEPPADLLGSTAPADEREPAPTANRFAAAKPRIKPDMPRLESVGTAPETREREDLDRLARDEDRSRDEGSEHEAGPEREDREAHDGGEHSGGDRDGCDRGDGGERGGGGEGGRWGH